MLGITEKGALNAQLSSINELPNQVTTSKNPTQITVLPTEVLLRIFQFATSEPSDATQPKTGVKTAAALSQTCRQWHSVANNDILQVFAEALLMHVLHGNAKKVKEIVSANPKLLFVKVEKEVKELASGFEEIENEQGQIQLREIPMTIKGLSPFQAMLRAGDIWMAEEIEPFIDAFREIALKQSKEQFPKSFEYPPCSEDFIASLNAVTTAITNDQMLNLNQDDQELDKTRKPQDITKVRINEFRASLLSKLHATTQGFHFNLNYLLKTYDAYRTHFQQWNWNQRFIFWSQIFAYLERLVPAVDAQVFCQGLYSLLEQNIPFFRSLELSNVHTQLLNLTLTLLTNWPMQNPKVFYFSGQTKLGMCFGVNLNNGALIDMMGPGIGHGAWPAHAALEKLCLMKTAGLERFIQKLEQSKPQQHNELQHDQVRNPTRKLTFSREINPTRKLTLG